MSRPVVDITISTVTEASSFIVAVVLVWYTLS